MTSFQRHKPITISVNDAEIQYFTDIFSKIESEQYLDILIRTIPWSQPKIKLFGRKIPIPRLSCWIGDKPYTYSGLGHKPRPCPAELQPIIDRVITITGINFNGVLINFYRNGLDSMGLHSDDEPELGERPIIASVSFGAARNFRLKRKDRLYNPISILLGSGSLLLMSGDTQKYWSHELPKTKKSIGPRINLTLRKIIV